jgi:hypothetical protein
MTLKLDQNYTNVNTTARLTLKDGLRPRYLRKGTPKAGSSTNEVYTTFTRSSTNFRFEKRM